ncbi:hypothetical protein [Sneathiella glossodoripedis]|uniref:hypothetical protein n=1 Tax=Sneathiella glossodoripedis TaxID=418853 RepID=UPI00046E682B|nr:hypothetical protein [Sneathiella glossodoripedis]
MTTDYYNTEEEENTFDLSQIISIAKRRFLFFLIPAVIGSIISFFVVYSLPQRYESLGTVLVESQQIPVELVQSTVTSDPNQRITIIQQRVLTRSNLLKVIDKYDVFPQERRSLSVSKLIEEMQKLIKIETIQSNQRSRNSVTIAFKVGFQHENPQIAAKVANELTTLFLNENVKTRTERASETTQFLEQEAEKLRKALVAAENAISEYKRENNESLPEHLDIRLGTLERIQSEIKASQQQLDSLRDERKYLELELSAAKSGTLNKSGNIETVGNTTELELKKAEDQLTQALTQLTEKHPTIKALKRKVAALEEKLDEELAASAEDGIETESSNPANPAIAQLVKRIQIRLDSNAKATQDTINQLNELKQKAIDTEALILKTPEVERGLLVLVRTHREIHAKYQELEAKQGKARLAQNLEEEKKAERFLLIEPPIAPTEPVWPNRPKFLGIGVFLAFATGIGTAVLMELVDKRVRSSRELEALLKHPPLVAIPFIKTQRDIQKKRYKLGAFLLAPTFVGAIGILLIHMYYKPLDILFYRAWAALERMNALPF